MNNTRNRVRLTESGLKHIIKETVNKFLNEADNFKQVDNLNDYVTSNGLQMKPASKFQRVNAQSGKSYINQYGKQNGMDKRQIGRMVRKGGAPLSTVAGDGTQETNNMVTRNHTVLNNVGNTANKWAAETPTFNRKYEQDRTQQGVYKPKGGPMNATQINEPISFTAPWGEKMSIDKGGYILQDPNNPNDIYGISGKDFDSTYKFNEGRNRIRISETQLHQIIKESIQNVLNEISPEYYANASKTAQDSISGFKGKMMKTFIPKQYNKRQQQATQFRDMSNDHPQDEWEITNQQMGSNPYDAHTYYTLRNTRTGEQRGYNDGGKEKPFRGRVIQGQNGDSKDADWLNNKQ